MKAGKRSEEGSRVGKGVKVEGGEKGRKRRGWKKGGGRVEAGKRRRKGQGWEKGEEGLKVGKR